VRRPRNQRAGAGPVLLRTINSGGTSGSWAIRTAKNPP